MTHIQVQLEEALLRVQAHENVVQGLGTLVTLEGETAAGQGLKLMLDSHITSLELAETNLNDIKATFGVKYWG